MEYNENTKTAVITAEDAELVKWYSIYTYQYPNEKTGEYLENYLRLPFAKVLDQLAYAPAILGPERFAKMSKDLHMSEHLIISGDIEKIPDNMFADFDFMFERDEPVCGLPALKTAEIEEGIRWIGDDLFGGQHIEQLVFPRSLTYIGAQNSYREAEMPAVMAENVDACWRGWYDYLCEDFQKNLKNEHLSFSNIYGRVIDIEGLCTDAFISEGGDGSMTDLDTRHFSDLADSLGTIVFRPDRDHAVRSVIDKWAAKYSGAAGNPANDTKGRKHKSLPPGWTELTGGNGSQKNDGDNDPAD